MRMDVVIFGMFAHDDVRNLMALKGLLTSSSTQPDRIDPRMSNWQVLLVQAKHITVYKGELKCLHEKNRK
jgi:hypothetical protein